MQEDAAFFVKGKEGGGGGGCGFGITIGGGGGFGGADWVMLL